MKSFTHERFSTAFQVASIITLLGYEISKSDDESITKSREQKVISASDLNTLQMTTNGYDLAYYQSRSSRELLAQKKKFKFIYLFVESPTKKNIVYGRQEGKCLIYR